MPMHCVVPWNRSTPIMSANTTPRPSGAGQWIICHGAPKLSALYPEDRDSEAAQEGTAAHWALAEVLNGRAVAEGQLTNAEFVLTREMVEAAEDMLRRVHGRIAHHGGETPRMYVEQWLDIDRIGTGFGGTVDLAMYFPEARTLYVDDFKYGFGWVEVFENWQLLCYTAGLLQLLNLEGRTNDLQLILGIHQPRAFHPDGPHRTWELTPAEARPYIARLNAAFRAATEPDPQLQVNPSCQHCQARHACPALQSHALASIDRSRSAVPFDLPPHALGIELADVRRAIKALQARETGLAGQAEALITRGERVPFWSIERKPGALEWTVPTDQVLAMGEMMGMALAKPRAAITPTQARDAGLSAEILAGFAERKAGTPKLALQDDRDARKIFS